MSAIESIHHAANSWAGFPSCEERFKPGTYIIDRDGFRGYVHSQCKGVPSAYNIRFAGGVSVRFHSDLEIDRLMEESE